MFQVFQLKHQVVFSLKNNEKIFMNVVCCSRVGAWGVNVVVVSFLVSMVSSGLKRNNSWESPYN